MKTIISFLIAAGVVTVVALAVVVAVVTATQPGDNPVSRPVSDVKEQIDAVVVFNIGTKDNGVSGVLELTQKTGNDPVIITGSISGLDPNTDHGFHVHASGDVREGCKSTGSHFNPGGHTHGGPTDTVRHVGDLGNVRSNSSGIAPILITDSVISLSGPNCIIGRAFVVHEKIDDLGKGGIPDSLTTGNAGGRLGCGIVGVIYRPKA